MRRLLEQMYLDMQGGEECVNEALLAILSDDDLVSVIVQAGKFGVAVSRLAPDFQTNVLSVHLKARRRSEVK